MLWFTDMDQDQEKKKLKGKSRWGDSSNALEHIIPCLEGFALSKKSSSLLQKMLRIGDFEKWLFWVGHFEYFFFKKEKKNCLILVKISHKLCVRMDGTQILWLWWFTAKNQSPQTFQPAVYMSRLVYIIG